MRKKGRERERVCDPDCTLLTREEEREIDNTARCGSISEVYAHQTQINPSSLSPGLSRRQGSLHHATCSLLAGRFDCEFCGGGGRIAGGDRSDEDHPSIFQKARDKKKKMLDLIRPPVAVCGPNMSNFHSPFPSTATPPWRPGIPVYV